jgi:hypothetical protein
MKTIPLRSLKMILFSLCVSSMSLFANFWQVPDEAVHCSYRLGHVQVLHDDDTGWSIIDNDGCPVQVEDCFVNQNIRYIENEDLIKILGTCYFDITATDLETGEPLAAYTSYTNSYLVVTMTDDGEYVIRLFMRGPGGGKLLGLVAGLVIKGVGYTAICVTCGPVGWAVAGWGAVSTIKSTVISFGVGKGAEVLSKAAQLKNLHKAMTAAEKAEKAVKGLEKAAKTADNVKKLADATETLNKARNLVTQLNAAKAAGHAINAAGKIKDGVEAAQNTVKAGAAGAKVAEIAAEAGAKALINPLVAGVDAVADIGQFIGELLPGI